jgi:sorbitol-specific phosphotransferase system component IIBC
MNFPVGSPPGIQFYSWRAIPVGVPWRSAHRKTIPVGHFAIPVGFTLTGLVAFLVVSVMLYMVT